MNRMTRQAMMLALAAAAALSTSAMTESEQNRMVWSHLDNILIEQPGHRAYRYFCKQDVDGDGIDDLVISTDERPAADRIVKAYAVGQAMRPLPNLAPSAVQALDGQRWTMTEYLMHDWMLPDDDITLVEPPIFISAMEKAKNEFSGWWADAMPASSYPQGNAYDRMVFKPHVGQVRFVGRDRPYTTLDGDTLWYDACQYRLTDPALVAKMFRGYSDAQAVPVVVTQRFLTTHQPMQFSRWLEGEPVRSMDRSMQQIVVQHYGTQYRVVRSQWLATLPTQAGNRSYYQVLLMSHDMALFATVCLAEGVVASAYEYDQYEQSGFNGDLSKVFMLESDVDGLFSDHLPEIMCIMHTPLGIEIYFRWASMEGTHYSIVREVGTRQLLVFDEYHYWMYG